MNERIRQLAFKANKDLDGNVPIGFAEKFAELIVKECISRCEGNGEYKNHNSEWGQGLAAGIELCKKTIKQHFGVEL